MDTTIKIRSNVLAGLLRKAIANRKKHQIDTLTTKRWSRDLMVLSYFAGMDVDITLFNLYPILRYADPEGFAELEKEIVG